MPPPIKCISSRQKKGTPENVGMDDIIFDRPLKPKSYKSKCLGFGFYAVKCIPYLLQEHFPRTSIGHSLGSILCC